MATSSIKKNFLVCENQVKKFADAVESSYCESDDHAAGPQPCFTHLKGAEEVKKFISQRKHRNV